jgi:hypothetical protein
VEAVDDTVLVNDAEAVLVALLDCVLVTELDIVDDTVDVTELDTVELTVEVAVDVIVVIWQLWNVPVSIPSRT